MVPANSIGQILTVIEPILGFVLIVLIIGSILTGINVKQKIENNG